MPVASATRGAPQADEPVGFPVPQTLRPMRVVSGPQGKTVAPAASDGPTVVQVATELQARSSNDEAANQYGWNCRTHNTHEGAPAVDWYLPARTPVIATMSGQVELYMISTTNAFSFYGVDPSLTLGLPSPSTPLFPLPGPGGGMGIFVSVLNGGLRAEYGHLDISTLSLAPENAFVAPYSKSFNFETSFARLREFTDVTLVASWPVAEGDVVGYVGNTGYSDAPHLHYQVVTRDRGTKFCPTREAFSGAGWLFGKPAGFP